MSNTHFILNSVAFTEVSQCLHCLGWHRDPDLTAIDPKEPEFASWSQSYDDELDYFYDPPTGLRSIHLRGEHAVQHSNEITRHLPILTLHDIETLLETSKLEEVLQGIAAVKALNTMSFIVPLARLCNHTNVDISKSAMQAFRHCFPDALQIGALALKQAKTKHPDHSVLFPHLGDATQRRQVLRWLIHDYSEPNDHILTTLRSALIDPDWEVRATAILTAARLNTTALIKLIRKVELPNTSREGLEPIDRQLLLAFRKATVAWLEGQRPPQHNNNPTTSRESMRWHVLRCVAGLPTTYHDRVFLLAHSLTEPIPHREPLPPNLPDSILEESDSYRLADTNLELVWIPPIPHWLGDDLEPPQNPIRSVHPETGFFITKRPLTQQWMHQQQPGFTTHKSSNNQTEYHTCTWQDAQQLCTALTQTSGLTFSLPTADEWEMAARGPDGRRFPWGNGFEKNMLQALSPWGCQDTVGSISQWTSTRSESGEIVICGGTDQLRCAVHTTAAIDQKNIGLRLVLRIVS